MLKQKMEQKHRPSILIVDDQVENMDTIKSFLNQSDIEYKYTQAPNGKIAYSIAEKYLPDLIIMDWEMPVMNGYDALVKIKNNELTKNIPIIMATARTSSEDLQKALKAGAIDYIRKPIEKLELLARVNSCLSISYYVKEIRRNYEKMEDLNREKDGMIGIVAHDLKSPLNKLKGFIYLIDKVGDLNAEQTDFTHEMNKIIDEGSDLIRDLLDVHSFEHQGSKLEIKQLDLKNFITSWLDTYKQEVDKKGQTLHLNLNISDTDFYTDKNSLSRILDNLLTNAIKFSKKDKSIYIDIFREDENINFSIRDEGPGISKQDQKKMFKKFQKLSAKPTSGENSTGLGLSIINALVIKLKGNITVNSELGEGTTIIVSLPYLNSKKN